MKKISLKMLTLVVVSIFVYLVRAQLFDGGGNAIIRIFGIIAGVVAVIYLIVEERMDLAFFSGRSQSAGSNANASVVAGLAVALIVQSWTELLVGTVVGIGVVLLISFIMKRKTI